MDPHQQHPYEHHDREDFFRQIQMRGYQLEARRWELRASPINEGGVSILEMKILMETALRLILECGWRGKCLLEHKL
jgi:hypothetical protein